MIAGKEYFHQKVGNPHPRVTDYKDSQVLDRSINSPLFVRTVIGILESYSTFAIPASCDFGESTSFSSLIFFKRMKHSDLGVLMSTGIFINELVKPLSTNSKKRLNTLKQFVDNLPTNSLSVFDYFVGLAPKRVKLPSWFGFAVIKQCQVSLKYSECLPMRQRSRKEIERIWN